MMKRPSQLTRLIWDFYRENPMELQQLKVLENCQVFRRWGVLHIRCWKEDVAEAVLATRSLLVEPIGQLRIAQKIQVSVAKHPVALFPVHSDKQFV